MGLESPSEAPFRLEKTTCICTYKERRSLLVFVCERERERNRQEKHFSNISRNSKDYSFVRTKCMDQIQFKHISLVWL